MSGVSPSSAVIVARRALFEAFRTALHGRKVDVRFGSALPVQHDDYAVLGPTTNDTTAPAIGDGVRVGSRRQRQETLTFRSEIGAWRAGHNDTAATAAYEAAYETWSLIADHIAKNDITLGGTVQWCLPGNTADEGIEADADKRSGFLVAIEAQWVCEHRVRPV